MLINALICFKLHILKFARAWVWSFYKNKNALVVRIANFCKRLDTVCSEVAVYRECVCTECVNTFACNICMTEVCRSICLHSCADIITLAVCDNEHTLWLCISDCVTKSLNTLPTVHFIICSLWLYGRNNIIKCVNKRLVEFKKCSSRTLKRLAVLFKAFCFDWFGNIVKLRIKTCNRRILHFYNIFDKSVKCHSDSPHFL